MAGFTVDYILIFRSSSYLLGVSTKPQFDVKTSQDVDMPNEQFKIKIGGYKVSVKSCF